MIVFWISFGKKRVSLEQMYFEIPFWIQLQPRERSLKGCSQKHGTQDVNWKYIRPSCGINLPNVSMRSKHLGSPVFFKHVGTLIKCFILFMSQKCFIENSAEPILKSRITMMFSEVLLCWKWRNLSIQNDSKQNSIRLVRAISKPVCFSVSDLNSKSFYITLMLALQ